MILPPRPAVIVGNWKMYKTIEESIAYVKGLLPLIQNASSRAYLAVPFTDIKPVVDLCKNTPLVIGGQNMHDANEGAFTGEIAGKMLKEAGARFVILGHSERRRFFGETNDFINKKVRRALEDELVPLLCIGETALERDRGLTENVLSTQLGFCLAGVSPEQMSKIFIAYEPVWAIGTCQVATPEKVQDAHSFCRKIIIKEFGELAGENAMILYGGSVNPENAPSLLEQPDVDGVLVGTASLSFESFSKIVNVQVSKQLKLSR